MCLYSKQLKPLKAKTDITVYKVVQLKPINSPTLVNVGEDLLKIQKLSLVSGRGFEYKLGVKNTTQLQRFSEYRNKSRVEQGFHSFVYKKTAFDSLSLACIVLECKIPKGSLYYKGTNNRTSAGYASDQLIAVKTITK